MITGIITTLLFIIVCLCSADKRIRKALGIFTRIHIPASITLAVAAVTLLLSPPKYG